MPTRCTCCGIAMDGAGPRAQIKRCMICDICDGLHGDALQIQIMKTMRAGLLPAGYALARMLIDDAHLAGRLIAIPDPSGVGSALWIERPVPKYAVVAGRAAARGELPDVTLLTHVTLARFIGLRATSEVKADLQRDLIEMMRYVDSSVLDVNVTTDMDVVDPEHLSITVLASCPTLGSTVAEAPDAGAAIPDDIMRRPRGLA